MFSPRSFAGLALILALPTAALAASAEGTDLLQADFAAEQICPQAILDLTQEGPQQLGVTLFSPCHAGQSVVLDHAGLVLSASVSDLGGFYASLPLLDAAEPVTVTFENGMMADARLPGAAVQNLQQVSASW